MQLSESVFPIPWGQFKLSVRTDVRVMSDIYFKEHTFFSILADVKEKKVESGLSTTCFVSSSGLGSTTPVTSMIDYETDPGFSVCGDGVLDRPSITTNCIFWPCSLITHRESAVFRLCCSVTQCYQMCIGGKLDPGCISLCSVVQQQHYFSKGLTGH